MRKQVVQTLGQLSLVVAIALTVFSVSAVAQSLDLPMRAKVPFEFKVGAKTFPAGEYSFQRSNMNSGDLIVRVNNIESDRNAFPMTIPVVRYTAQEKGSVVFNRYGDEYFLAEIWAAGATTGRALPRSNEEREVRHKYRDITRKLGQRVTITIEVATP